MFSKAFNNGRIGLFLLINSPEKERPPLIIIANALSILIEVPEFLQSNNGLICLIKPSYLLTMYVFFDTFVILWPKDFKKSIVTLTSPEVKGFLIIDTPSARLAAIKAR
ncbi:hypothetical protein ES705_41737 [subsurface metagenome]